MKSFKKLIATVLLAWMIIQIISIADAATLKDTVNAIQATPTGLPNVANPRGNFGNLLSELFWGVGDGTKNGTIKPQYLDYSGISTWTTTGSNAYYEGTGSVGIGISSPYAGAKLHVLNGVSAAGSYNTNRDDFIVENGSGPAGITVMSAINNPAGIELRSGGGISFIAAFTNPTVNSDTSFSVQWSNVMTLQTGGNIGIGTTAPAAKLQLNPGTGTEGLRILSSNFSPFVVRNTADTADLFRIDQNGNVTGGNIPSGAGMGYDEATYFAPQAQFEAGSFPFTILAGVTPSFATVNNTNVPFSKVATSTVLTEFASDFIPVQPGDTLYGEIWAMRETGSVGNAGWLYYGVAQYDKDKKPIAGNKALNYFVTNNSTVPQNSVWNKYSGTITLATSHTPYSTSDGGPVRYVQAYVIVNYQTGTIPTNYGGILLRRATPFRDSGAVSFNGNVGIGTKSPQTALDANGRIRAFGWGTEPTSGTSLELWYVGGIGRIMAFNRSTSAYSDIAIGWGNQLYVQSGGNVGIGTASPGTKLAIQSDANTSGAPANAQFYIQGTSSTAKRLSIAYNTSSNYGELSAETSPGVYSPIVLNPNGGSIGIGTALPGTLFDVAGSGNQNWISHFKNSANANGNDIYFGYTNTGTNATRGMYINGGGGLSSDFDLLVGALGKLTVTGAGNVGIGTTSPGSKLDVQDINNWNNGPAMNVTRTQNQNSSVGHGVKVDLTTAGTPASVNLYWLYSDVYTSGGSSTNYGLYVNRGLGYFGGNVGIGSTNPSELLTLSGASGPIIGLNGATTNYRGIKMSNSVWTEQWFAGANASNNYVVRQGGSTDIMTFSGGNIGIGVGSPDSKLTVYGNLKVLFTANPYDRNAASIVDLGISGITGASNWALRGTYQYGNGVSYNSVGGDLDLIKSMDGNTILGTKKDGTALGYVGIGTTSPGTTLAVKGSISKETITGIDNTWDNFIKYWHYVDLESWTANVNRWHGIDATISAWWAANNKMKFRVYGGGTGNAPPVDVMTLQWDGNIIVNSLAATYANSSAFVCVNNSGQIYASEVACP